MALFFFWQSEFTCSDLITLQMGPASRDFESKRRKLKLQVRVSPKPGNKVSIRPNNDAGNRHRHHPESTNVSSPVQQMAKRRRKAQGQIEPDAASNLGGYVHDDFVVSDGEALSDDEFNDSSDGFEPIRQRGKLQRREKPQVGPPIASDDRMATVTDLHRIVIEDFVHRAKDLGERVSTLEFHRGSFILTLDRSKATRDFVEYHSQRR